ncbi:MAG: hypothetical protein ABDH20_00545 [Thermus sp.]
MAAERPLGGLEALLLPLRGKRVQGPHDLARLVDEALRGTPYRAQAAGTLYTPAGLLRGGILVEEEGVVHLVIWTPTPRAARAALELLPRILEARGMGRVRAHPVGAVPGEEPGQASDLLDTRSLGLSLSLALRPGEYAAWWCGKGEVFPYTPAAEVLEAWVRLVAGREEQALLSLLRLLGLEAGRVDLEEVLLPLESEVGHLVLSYRPGRPPRLHFPRSFPRGQALGLLANLTRLLRRELHSLPRQGEGSLHWWQEVLREGEKEEIQAIGHLVI